VAPDLMSIDPSFEDDAHLLAAVERAWPVPPIPGRLTNVAFTASEPVAPGNLVAPMVPTPARRSWSLLARIAAVIALVLAGTLAITHENGPERGAPIFIQAPSPVTADCSVPLRSRQDLEALIARAEQQDLSSTGHITTQISSVYEMSPATEQEAATLEAITKEQQRCMRNGLPYSQLTSISGALVESIIASNLAQGIAPEKMLELLLTPYPADTFQNQQSYAWDLNTNRVGDDLVLTTSPDEFGNLLGSRFVQQQGQWVLDGPVIVLGPWSSLAANVSSNDVEFQSLGCDPGTLRTSRDVQTLNKKINDEGLWPPVDTTSPLETFSGRGATQMSSADQQTIIDVVNGYRHCLGSGNRPYQFSGTTEAFFRRHVITDGNGVVVQPYGVSALSPEQQSLIPSDVQSVIQLDDGRAIAILESNPEWAEASGLKAGILLVNQNGQWLIDQLVLVENQS
jgi:hypothetical protein